MLYSREWSVLGPFQIGTREGAWGSDSLEYFGGFHSLRRDASEAFPSSLARKGKVKWSNVICEVTFDDQNGLSANLIVNFDDMDWKMMQGVYGWPALQYQAWLRGVIGHQADSAKQISLSIDNVLEFWLDDERYFGGDLYAYRRSPLFLNVPPGPHVLELRLVRDVRAMGAMIKPSVLVHLKMKVHMAPIYIHAERHHFPDVVLDEGGQLRLSSTAASVLVSNTTEFDLEISRISSASPLFDIVHDPKLQIRLAAGQTRPLAFLIGMAEQYSAKQAGLEAQFIVHFRECAPGRLMSTVMWNHTFKIRSISKFHRVTYINPIGGGVAYSMLRAPPRLCGSHTKSSPVMVFLHGAGVDADSDQAIDSLDDTEDFDAWLIISEPSTTWGSDDWHEIGIAGVKAGVDAIQAWIKNIDEFSYAVTLDSVMVIGHSNGGQGAWYFATHWPDSVFALVVVSGYNSIQAYVPYQLWRETSPSRRAVLDNVLADYRHELLLPNVKGVPIFQQHCADDDNVPVYHARRMAELLHQSNWYSTYSEIQGGHWFDGIMTTKGLKQFYSSQLHRARHHPNRLTSFEFVVANPRSTGAKNGLMVEELVVPGQLGVVRVRFRDSTSAHVVTENVKRLSFSDRWIEIDKATIDADEPRNFRQATNFPISFENTNSSQWIEIEKREPFHLGGLHAVLQTESSLAIVYQDETILQIAYQIARNMLQYFAMDTEIVHCYADITGKDCNVVTVMAGGSRKLLPSHHPITISNADTVMIEDSYGNNRSYNAQINGLGAVFLSPRANSRLELVVWGSDAESLRVASRLVPTLTGIGQPDFIIMDKSIMWKGLGGVLALGFFDSRWKSALTSWFS